MNALSELNNKDRKNDEVSIIKKRYTNIVSRMSMGMRKGIVLLEHTSNNQPNYIQWKSGVFVRECSCVYFRVSVYALDGGKNKGRGRKPIQGSKRYRRWNERRYLATEKRWFGLREIREFFSYAYEKWFSLFFFRLLPRNANGNNRCYGFWWTTMIVWTFKSK